MMLAGDELEFLLDSLPDTVLVCASDGRIRACNLQCRDLLGYERAELVGMPVESLIPEPLRPAHTGYRMAYQMAPRRRSMYQLQEIQAVRRDGTLQPVSIALSPITLDAAPMTIVVIRDNAPAVAARLREKEMYERLLQKQRLENLGVLSSGIAHDFRNVLSIVLGNAELALHELGDAPGALWEHLQEIHRSSARLQDLSDQILRYASGHEARPEPVNLNACVEEMAVLLQRALGRGTTLRPEPAALLPDLLLDPGHIFQVLLNLVLNANDALAPTGGNIVVRTGVEDGRVFLQVEDDGRGIDTADRSRILEPFFTTKDGGKGLGLAVVNAIVERYDGSLRIDSQAGSGAIFTVLFPVQLQCGTQFVCA